MNTDSNLDNNLLLQAQKVRIKRRIYKHFKLLGFRKKRNGLFEIPEASKNCFRALHHAQRKDKLDREESFVNDNWPKLAQYFADGNDVDPSKITPRLELVEGSKWQSRLFRLASLMWSIPVSNGYGRRMRFLVWDASNQKLIGLLALGDPIYNLKVRDEWIGWSAEQRRQRLVNLMDAYVLGAVPPYNMLLGGKLIASLVRTAEVKDYFTMRYSDTVGQISKINKNPKLCLVTTTSALGRSSLYNRLNYKKIKTFNPIGYTSGWGHFHIPDDLFQSIRELLSAVGDKNAKGYIFGDGPNWKIRTIKKALSLVGIDPDILKHGIEREVFVCPMATNAKEVLAGNEIEPFYDLPTVCEVGEWVRNRWIIPRASRYPEYRQWQAKAFLNEIRISPQVQNH